MKTPVTITNQAFTDNPQQAQQQAKNSPVIITKDDTPWLVLLSYDDYQRLLSNNAQPEKPEAATQSQGGDNLTKPIIET